MKEQYRIIKFLTLFTREVVLNIVILFLSILIFFIFPLVLVLSIPLYLFRYFIAKSAQYVKPSLGKMVTTRSQVFTADDLFNKPKCNIIVAITVEGNVDIELATQNAYRTLLGARLPNGELTYPELKQYLTTWAGYYFWKDDKKFDLKNHVKLHPKYQGESDRFGEEDVQEIRQEIIEKKWTKKRPMWDVTCLPNCYLKGTEDPGPHTTIILRFHHSLGDGYSWLFLLIEGLCEKKITNALPNYFKRPAWQMFFYSITFPFRASFTIAQILIFTFLSLPWRVVEKEQTGRFNVHTTDRIPVSKIKDIKTHFKVSFSTVIFSVLAGAMREIMIKKGMDVPKSIPGLTTLPIPGHSVKLRNYMTGAVTTFPIGEPDPLRRLKLCQKNYNSLKRSTTPIIFKYFFMFAGSYFTWITKKLGKNHTLTTGLSNFPGGFEYMSYNGHKCVDAMFSIGLQSGCAGVGFCALSYVDGFRMSPSADTAVMTKEEVKELAGLLEKHIDTLHQLVINTV